MRRLATALLTATAVLATPAASADVVTGTGLGEVLRGTPAADTSRKLAAIRAVRTTCVSHPRHHSNAAGD